jgi:hypothetical protein
MPDSERESFASKSANVVQRAQRVRELNERFRRTFLGGRVLLTNGVQALPPDQLIKVLHQVREFAAFSSENDPYQEHDFGAVEGPTCGVFWKIDYYDKQLAGGSPDPADPAVTERVLTIMLAEEY